MIYGVSKETFSNPCYNRGSSYAITHFSVVAIVKPLTIRYEGYFK